MINKYLAILVVFITSVFVSGVLSFNYGKKEGIEEVTLVFNKYMLDQQSKIIELSEQNKEISDKLQHSQVVLQGVKEDANKQVMDISRELANSLRDRTSRTERTDTAEANDPPTEYSNSTREGRTGKELFREDAEFLIGEATSAMILRNALIECRASRDLLEKSLMSN